MTPVPAPVPASEALLATIRQLDQGKGKGARTHAYVPDLVRALSGQLAKVDVHHALRALAAQGAVELLPDARPTSAIPSKDLLLCPSGETFDGVLSTVVLCR